MRQGMIRMRLRAWLAVVGLLLAAGSAGAAEHVKIGGLKTTGAAPLYLGVEKGFFAAEGLDA